MKSTITTTDSKGNVLEFGKFTGTTTVGHATLTATGYADGYVAQFNPAGEMLWCRQISNAKNYSIENTAIKTDADGNVYILGRGPKSGTIIGGMPYTYAASSFQGLIAKLDADGNWLWVKVIPGTQYNMPKAMDIDGSGDIYVVGAVQYALNAQTLGKGQSDAYVMKFDTDGNVLWTATGGGALQENFNSVALDADCGLFVVGAQTSKTATYGKLTAARYMPVPIGNVQNSVIAHLNCATGDYDWVKVIPCTNTNAGVAVVTDADGVAYVAGYYSQYKQTSVEFGSHSITFTGGLDTYLAAIDIDGDWQWAVGYGSAGADIVSGLTLEDGILHVTGSGSSAAEYTTDGEPV